MDIESNRSINFKLIKSRVEIIQNEFNVDLNECLPHLSSNQGYEYVLLCKIHF